jgi:hypothetical protein
MTEGENTTSFSISLFIYALQSHFQCGKYLLKVTLTMKGWNELAIVVAKLIHHEGLLSLIFEYSYPVVVVQL